ncbi:hypothetical protein RF55_26126, partial [Lasius niger]
MSKDMECIVRTQFELFGRISRANENLKKSGAANITVGLLEARLGSLASNWEKFEANHENLSENHWNRLAGTDYLKKDLMTLTEEAYLTQKGLFLDALRELKREEPGEAPTSPTSAPLPPRTTLPRIQLPQFSGQYEEWPSFRDLFHSLIAKDSSTSQVEKLHYLKSCVK